MQAQPVLVVSEAVPATISPDTGVAAPVNKKPVRIPRRPPESDTDAAQRRTEPDFIDRGLNAAEYGSKVMGRTWVGFSRGVDNYFAGDVRTGKENNSHLRLRLDTTIAEAGENESDARIKARIDLPNTRQRFRLIFDSDDRGDDSLEERVRPVSTGERVRKDESVAGLELLSRLTNGWQASTSGGVRLNSELVPYGKIKLQRDFKPNEYWLGTFEQHVKYYDDSGWRESTELELLRPINDDLFFNSYTEAEYKDEDNQFEFVHILALNKRIGDRNSVVYRTGVFGASQPNPRTTGYFVGLSFRRRVHSDWMFLTIAPEIFYPREEGWAAEPSINFELEMFFTEN